MRKQPKILAVKVAIGKPDMLNPSQRNTKYLASAPSVPPEATNSNIFTTINKFFCVTEIFYAFPIVQV